MEPHRFHEVSDHPVTQCLDRNRADRRSDMNGICFTRLQVEVEEPIFLRILAATCSFPCGPIGVGFTTMDPSKIDPSALSNTYSHDTLAQPEFWVKPLPQVSPGGMHKAGDIVKFLVDQEGHVLASLNAGLLEVIAEGVNTTKPLWAVINLCGSATSVRLEDEDQENHENHEDRMNENIY